MAHLRGVNNCGTSLKPHDWFTVPLCRHHHEEEEPIGPDQFGDRHGIDLWAIAEKFVLRSPDWKMRDAWRAQLPPVKGAVDLAEKRAVPRPIGLVWFATRAGTKPVAIPVVARVS